MERYRARCWICRSTLVRSGGFWELHYILPFQPTPASTYTGRRAQPATILRCSARLRCSETEWTASFGTVTLTLDRNIIRLHALQQDATNPVERGNHNGGIIRFGPDGKLYIFIGDNGRRGQLQNLPDGPFGPGIPDDQFGGPEPDNAHLTGVVLRLNDDGTTPADNPFFAAGAALGGEVGANIQKIFSYGHRNSFGMAFDPFSGKLWLQENGDDSF